MSTFSQRRGFAPADAPIIIRDEAPGWLRDFIVTSAQEVHVGPSDLRDMLCSLLLESPDSNNWSAGNIEREVRELMCKAEWFHVYDFIETIAQRLERSGMGFLRQFEEKLNDAFRRKGVGWQLLDGQIEIRGEESFEQSVRTAIAVTAETGRSVAESELHGALQDLSKRPTPAVTGAIRHAMAALECVARDVTGDQNATLGEIIKRHPGLLPAPLDKGVEKIWGYASDQARHVREGTTPDIREAELVVGLAGSLTTYLVKKSRPKQHHNLMPEPSSVRSLITPQDQTLRTVFNAQRSYFIDIYQREYKWTNVNVETLLNDIEVRFTQYQRPKSAPKEIQEDVLERFEPYFLNTYLTSTTAATTSIVDGQQRLTTLLLILIKLYRVLKKVEENPDNRGKTFSAKVVEQLIFETNDFGSAERFKIYNENREAAFRALAEGAAVETTDQTRTRIAENFNKVIDPYFEAFLKGQQPGEYDLVKTTYYLTYLLDRISIVEIRIERQENVAMIFEVVNDRGLGLRPYEILKGKLIGNLIGVKKEQANEVWTNLQERYFKVKLKSTTETALDLDMFFQTFFRAKFADSESEYEKFENDYHYEMYRNERVKQYFGNFQNRDLLFNRITADIKYFAELYLEIRTSYEHEHLIFNKLLDQNQQYLLIMSAVKLNDPERSQKIDGIAAKFDQFHTVLRLLDAYDSNSFQRLIYPLNKDVRDKSLAEIKPLFDAALITSLVAENIIQAGQCANAAQVFEFERFKGVRNQWTNFSKYILMRIDRHLADLLDKPSFAAEGLGELEDRFNKNNLRRYGMHLEHIYTQHDANRDLFTTNGHFDESAFQQKRNLLGMVLLLKDKQNLSSNNEIYADKQHTYAQSNLIWNELLVGHLPNVDRQRLPVELRVEPVQPENQVFPLVAVDARQKVTFEAIKRIWGQA